MRARTVLAVALAMIPVMAVASCAGDDSEISTVEQDGLIAVVRTGPADGGMDAQISGELISGPGSCLALEVEGSLPQVVIWPEGTELETGDQPGVQVPGVGTVRLGEQLEHSGGYADNDAYTLPEPCRIDDENAEVIVLND